MECDEIKLQENNVAYIFNEVPEWDDYFFKIRENRKLVIDSFLEYFDNGILKRLSEKSSPSIGVHIRMSDFRVLKEKEDFSKVGAVRTPLNYFITLINNIREVHGSDLDVEVFSDGHKHELDDILQLPNTKLAEEDSDLGQILHLSKSKIIILSAGSTFGQWSAFFSEAAIINHYQHFHSYIRDEKTNKKYFEGIVLPNETLPNLLLQSIKQLS